jgi:predicted  nucleic acid-binding Zn-ribbon protein
MQLKKKNKNDDLKKELDQINAEIHWKEESIKRSIDYGQTNKFKREIQSLKSQQVDLLKDLEQWAKQKTLKNSRRLATKKNYINRKGIARML